VNAALVQTVGGEPSVYLRLLGSRATVEAESAEIQGALPGAEAWWDEPNGPEFLRQDPLSRAIGDAWLAGVVERAVDRPTVSANASPTDGPAPPNRGGSGGGPGDTFAASPGARGLAGCGFLEVRSPDLTGSVLADGLRSAPEPTTAVLLPLWRTAYLFSGGTPRPGLERWAAELGAGGWDSLVRDDRGQPVPGAGHARESLARAVDRVFEDAESDRRRGEASATSNG